MSSYRAFYFPHIVLKKTQRTCFLYGKIYLISMCWTSCCVLILFIVSSFSFYLISWTSFIFNRIHLEDHGRLSQLIRLIATDLAQGISYRGHLYSMRRASSSLSHCADMKEKTAGLSQVCHNFLFSLFIIFLKTIIKKKILIISVATGK